MSAAAAVPPDATLELAKVVGVAIAAGTVDRDELFDLAHRVVDGPDRYAQRLGFVVAVALIDALQSAPRPAPSTETARSNADQELDAPTLADLSIDKKTLRGPYPRRASRAAPLPSPATIATSDVPA